MATAKIFVDNRRILQDGTYPVKVRVNHIGTFAISTGLYCRSGEFAYGEFVGDNARERNIKLRKIYNQIERTILTLEDNETLDRLNDIDLKGWLTDTLDPNKLNRNYFISIFDEYMRTIKALSTVMIYRQTRQKVEEFDGKVTWLQMNKAWLKRFESYMYNSGLSTNTISIHLRNLRTLCNYALDLGITTIYPFRGFKIKSESTAHRDLSLEQLQAIRDCDIEPYQQRYKDAFMLSFYLIGMNPADMFNPRTTIRNGRVVYERMKTGKYYSIDIQPEAEEILKRYGYKMENIRGEQNQSAFRVAVNRDLKKLSWTKIERVGLGGRKVRQPIEEELTMYWARHTWATMAHRAGVDKDTISLALGHSFGCRITDVYIDYDRCKIDEANRKVLDYIKGQPTSQLATPKT